MTRSSHQQAERWGNRVRGSRSGDRINGMFVDAFGRPPSDEERRDCLAFVAGRDDAEAWADLAHALLNVKEFIFVG